MDDVLLAYLHLFVVQLFLLVVAVAVA